MKKSTLRQIFTTFCFLLFVANVSFGQVPSYVPTSNLIAWYPFNGNALDESSNTNDGLVNGASLAPDRFGNLDSAYNFDGIDDFISIPSLNNFQYIPVTYSMWFYLESYPSNTTFGTFEGLMIIGRDQFGNTSEGIFGIVKSILSPPDTINNKLLYYTGCCGMIKPETPTLNAWHHLVFTYDISGNFNWYFDGVLADSGTNLLSSTANIAFNIGSGGNRWFWDGSIDDIGIWNRALTPCEVNQMYSASLSTGVDIQTACDDFLWIDGNTYTSSTNLPTFTLTNMSGCDSVVTLNLTMNYSNTGTDIQTACDDYLWIDGNTYTSSTNLPTFTLTNMSGCDSVVTLNLTMNYSNTGTDIQTACDDYLWIDGNTYTSSTNLPTFTLTNMSGCDSVVTLNLTMNYSNTGTDIQTACDDYLWIDGNTYTSSTNLPTFTLTNMSGCDSVVTLNLTMNYSNTGTDIQTSCDDYLWIDGNTYTSSTNLPTFTLTNMSGCDSVVTLNLTMNYSNTGTDIQTSCDDYLWIDGNTYTSSTNLPTFTLTNMSGCDSVVTLNLTKITVDTSVTNNDPTLVSNSIIATYQWIDCGNGNGLIAGANSASYNPSSNGSYAVIVTKDGCTDTSACYMIVTVGVEELNDSEIILVIYPNPSEGFFSVKCLAFDNLPYIITDLSGKEVLSGVLKNNITTIDLSEREAGVYFMYVSGKTFHLIKQ